MAKKKKDDIDNDEDINQDAQGDFNEADDNFGLPDVDYDPIDREEETYSSEEESTSEDVYASQDDSYSEDYQSDADQQENEYVPGSYTPPKDDSMAPKIIGLVIVLLLAAGAIYYFAFYKPKQDAIAEKARIEQQRKAELEKQKQGEAAAAERRRQEELAAQRAAEEAAEAEKNKVGTIETISSRTGRYYVVVSSAIDDDLAMDYAKRKQKEGVSTFILEPIGTSKFYRVALADFETWNDAQSAANDYKGEYGDAVWVIKY